MTTTLFNLVRDGMDPEIFRLYRSTQRSEHIKAVTYLVAALHVDELVELTGGDLNSDFAIDLRDMDPGESRQIDLTIGFREQ